jgi:hypothetical protein
MIRVCEIVEELLLRHGASIDQIEAECVYLSREEITEMVALIESGKEYQYTEFSF